MIDDETRPENQQKSLVDVTIEPEQMVAARDELRLRLKTQYHMLSMLARANRKVGNREQSQRAAHAAERVLLMLWTVENPMKDLAPEVRQENAPRGASARRRSIGTDPV